MMKMKERGKNKGQNESENIVVLGTIKKNRIKDKIG